MLLGWFLIVLAITLIGITKSGFGSGVGLMIVPITLIGMQRIPGGGGAQTTLGLILPLLVVGDFIAVAQYRKLFDRTIIARMLPGTIVGVVVGGAVLFWMDNKPPKKLTSFIEIEIAMESILLVSLHWYRTWREGHERPFRPSVWRSSAVGAFAGVSSTLAHAAGPIVALHLLPQKLEKRHYVGTSAVYFFLVNTAKVPVYIAFRQFHASSLGLSLKLLPLVFIGAGLGLIITRKLSDRVFTRVIYFVTFCLGWYLLVEGVRQLRA